MRAKMIRGILVSLLRADEQPMPQMPLMMAAQLMCRPDNPTDGDMLDVIKELQAQQFIHGAMDSLTKETIWALTGKGLLKARELR